MHDPGPCGKTPGLWPALRHQPSPLHQPWSSAPDVSGSWVLLVSHGESWGATPRDCPLPPAAAGGNASAPGLFPAPRPFLPGWVSPRALGPSREAPPSPSVPGRLPAGRRGVDEPLTLSQRLPFLGKGAARPPTLLGGRGEQGTGVPSQDDCTSGSQPLGVSPPQAGASVTARPQGPESHRAQAARRPRVRRGPGTKELALGPRLPPGSLLARCTWRRGGGGSQPGRG